MGDYYAGPALHCPVKSLLNDFLGVFIEGASGFIQDQDLWVLDQSSRNSNSLLLPAWELGTFKSTNFVKARVELEPCVIGFDKSFGKLIEPRQLMLSQSFFALLYRDSEGDRGLIPFDKFNLLDPLPDSF